MSEVYVARIFHADYAHRVLGHESRCKHLHGHRAAIEVTVKSQGKLDNLGRVIDFGVVKELIGKWIDDNWDHNILLHPDDPLLSIAGSEEVIKEVIYGGREPYLMCVDGVNVNPTAENMAKVLFRESNLLLPSGIEVVRVRVWETPNCFAEYRE